ncbi:MAG: SMC-Scp complex subunit ScpB [Lachnospiraceae bacterium]|nr:SMC-Scp complex subunit ScpB [Lachnospiraceae bacterium]
MESGEKKAIMEAILFTFGEALKVERLAAVIETEEEETKRLLTEMKAEYDEQQRGIALVELDDAFQMCTRGTMYEYLQKIASTPQRNVLTDTLLETLSIIAYKQPITRLEIEKIRGVSCDHAVNRLLELQLISELGRMDAPGRPLLFGTTVEFLRCFGIKSLDDLPQMDSVRVEELKIEVEQELKRDS